MAQKDLILPFMKVVRETWFSRNPDPHAVIATAITVLFLFLTSFSFFNDTFHSDAWMAATPDAVFLKHEFWRAWTTLFAHGDMGHLLSNSLLFIPLAYWLSGYFGVFFFPLTGIFFGGLTNLIVLKTLPGHIALIGISGVVYWMGAAWFTLLLLIDRRERLRRRFARILFLIVLLFIPETYKPEIGYLSHFVGFFLGVLSAIGLYWIFKKRFTAAEVIEILPDEEETLDLPLSP